LSQVRRLAVCADDFGHSRALSRTVVGLAQRGRLTAVSCLSSGLAWRESAPMLRCLPDNILCGLHFNLTLHSPSSADLRRCWPQLPALPALLLRAAARVLPLEAIAAEWRAQWEAFVQSTGRAPDFIDGHQHVHHLPGVREVILRHLPPDVAVRNTGRLCGPGFAFKRAVIAASGGRRLKRLLEGRGVPHNAVLVGVYDFRHEDYRALVQGWLQRSPETGALLFCHPGDGGCDDPIAPARRREARYLASSDFVEDLQSAGVSLGHAWLRSSSIG